MTDFAEARRNMVENQLRPNSVDDPRVLEAMGTVPRERFVPKRLRAVAYHDEDIDLGEGRHVIEPRALGRALECLALEKEDVALVMGCDTGYAAAVLARLVATVFLLVPDAERAARIESLLEELGCANVVVQVGDPREGHSDQAPFNVILIAGSVSEIPERLLGQLDEGGRLACVVQPGRIGKLTIVTRVGDAYGRVTPYDACVPPVPELVAEPSFTF